eukprot:CAMPEP_0115322948 /NCGR_PEP_ID=MMETSP0270-20121206/81672_1 /TAXON_ID=71861 /ORGANISM="Scrippsiella trochoidea, Strain CCMP3099" /LENGTH=57 /DNA_ID=CAMNT_0002742943 /DNA_START=184 /DNA_END=357 /DNA_ORIENTATION=-
MSCGCHSAQGGKKSIEGPLGGLTVKAFMHLTSTPLLWRHATILSRSTDVMHSSVSML